MRAALASCLQVPVDAVSVKATTLEGLGDIGGRRALAAHAVVLLLGA
jgi:2C-methyl-D-erythritol 2,4-cyclodiphosphate synthase